MTDGVVHKLPSDLKRALISEPKSMLKWQSLTPLARNEWICWVESVKKQETRIDHIKRTVTELVKGKRRPCCWIGCIHRTDKEISSSIKWVLSRRSKTNS